MNLRLDLDLKIQRFPFLKTVKDENLGGVCYKIFECGYDTMFPNNDEINKNKNLSSNSILLNQTNSINSRIDCLKNDICMNDKVQIFDEKFNDLTDILTNMMGINNNSSKKGKIGEDFIINFIKKKFQDYSYEFTRSTGHSGDLIIVIPIDNKGEVKVMIEIKNYSKSVDKDEILKFKNDLREKCCSYGIIFSLKSGFIGHKKMELENYCNKGGKYSILYVPHIDDDISKIESSVIFMEKIIQYEKKQNDVHFGNINVIDIQKNINNHLSELNDVYDDFKKLKESFLKMELSIKNSFDAFYEEFRNNDILLQEKINKIFKSINSEINYAIDPNVNNGLIDNNIIPVNDVTNIIQKCKISDKVHENILSDILILFEKCKIKIIILGENDSFSAQQFNIFLKINDPLNGVIDKGTLTVNKSYVIVNLFNPYNTFNYECKKSHYKKFKNSYLDDLKKYLSKL